MNDELMNAASVGNVKKVNELIEKGADINTMRGTPLLYASKNGHTKVVKLLIEKGAKINIKQADLVFTPLHWASNNGHLEVVKLLLLRGLDPMTNVQDIEGANINVPDSDGATPLHWAIMKGLTGVLKVVKLLIENGADIVVENNQGNTPFKLIKDEKTKFEKIFEKITAKAARIGGKKTTRKKRIRKPKTAKKQKTRK